MQREHAKVYFQPLIEKKSLLDISNLILKSITISVFLDLVIQNQDQKVIDKSIKMDLAVQNELSKHTAKTYFLILAVHKNLKECTVKNVNYNLTRNVGR